VPPVNDNLESSYVYKLVTSPITWEWTVFAFPSIFVCNAESC
jgi:hypothetical protein